MKFKHKLAHRLALLKGRFLVGAATGLALLWAASCEKPVTLTEPNQSVAQFVVSPKVVTLQQNQVQDFTAVGFMATGDTAQIDVTWTATGGTLDTNSVGKRHFGHYKNGQCGAFKIIATSHPGSKSDTASVTVTCPVSVASVTVSPATASVQAGQRVQLTANPKDANGNPLTGRTVTWSSSNPTVATVDPNGLVTGVTAGSATITATSEGQSGTATVTISAPTGQFAIGDSVQTTVAAWVRNISRPPADPATGTPPSVIGTQPAGARGVVDSGPVLNTTPGGDGAIRYHVLFAAAPSGWVVQGYLAKIVPTVPVAAVTVTPASVSVLQGQTVQLTATLRDANGTPLTGRVITWQSSTSAIASVNGSGLVSGVAAGGPVTMTATSEGQSGTASVTVTLAPVTAVTVTPSSGTVAIGRTVQLTATPRDASGNPLTGRAIGWSSSDNTIATVNSSGLVTGVVAGAVTITATSEGQSGTASITVSGVPVASVTVSPASASVPVGQTVQLSATLRDANGAILTGRPVAWASNNTAAATVTGTGLVSAKVAGSATITATSEGQSGTAAMTVTPSAGAQFDHVFIVLEENNDYSSVTSSSMPYLTGLAAQYGLATQYYANTHPSIGNYLDMTSGTV